MPVDTTPIDRALGAIGTTFRLVRLYPATHPAVVEATRQVAAALPALAAMGTLEWKVGATGLHWHGQHILPRNHQVGELAGLLYARGVRAIQLNPGLTPDHVLALFNVAVGHVPPDDATLGRIMLLLGRRSRVSARLSAPVAVAPAAPSEEAPPAPAPADAPGARAGGVFRPDVLPADVEARRVVVALRTAAAPETLREALARLEALTADLLALRDAVVVAEVIAALDAVLGRASEGELAERVGAAAGALAEPAIVDRMLTRLGEARVPPSEREALVQAVGALAAITAERLVETFLAAPADLREPYRAAIRVAADRAIEPLEGRLADKREEVVATAAHFLGLTGAPAAVALLVPLIRHASAVVREAALLGLAELGGREISRPAMPALKDESALVRLAAARAIGVGGDASATRVLIRRLDQEEDEGALAELLRAIGRLGAPEALEVLAGYADPGGRVRRRTAYVRAAAIEGLARVSGPEARALLELYRRDKDPAVKRAAEAGLK